jgi:UDP-N-acetylglucosamine:LPS N-acetylglucosamine transferase
VHPNAGRRRVAGSGRPRPDLAGPPEETRDSPRHDTAQRRVPRPRAEWQPREQEGRALRPSPRKVLLVGSSGGHLAQLVALRPWYDERERAWVTFDTLDARSQLDGERVFWAAHPTTRNIPNLVRNLFLAFRLLPRERPDVVVSTGAGVAVPFFVVARLLGIRTVYVEVYDRLDSRTLTARLCSPFTDLFCVQWEEQRALYPNATVIGQLL